VTVKKFLLAFMLGVLVHFAGCAVFTDPVSQKNPAVCAQIAATAQPVCNEAGQAFLKAEGLLIAVNQTIKQNADARLWTKDQAQSYLDRSKAARLKLDAAYDVFKSGDYGAALSQANLTNTLLQALLTEVAREQAKQGVK
jgi:hypothetical protein